MGKIIKLVVVPIIALALLAGCGSYEKKIHGILKDSYNNLGPMVDMVAMDHPGPFGENKYLTEIAMHRDKMKKLQDKVEKLNPPEEWKADHLSVTKYFDEANQALLHLAAYRMTGDLDHLRDTLNTFQKSFESIKRASKLVDHIEEKYGK